MQIDQTALAIVDRKCARLRLSGAAPTEEERRAWLDELPSLLQWILSVPTLNAYVQQILCMHEADARALDEASRAALDHFVPLADALRALPGESEAGWQSKWTWEAFDGAVAEVRATTDRATVRKSTEHLARILMKHSHDFAERVDDEKSGEASAPVLAEITHVCEAHVHRVESWDRVQATSPRTALADLLELCRAIHPPPDAVEHWTDLIPRGRMWAQVDGQRVMKHLAGEADAARVKLARFVEELHVLGASTFSYGVAVERFRQRSAWYDKARIRAVAEDERIAGKREDRLTMELAKYLHDSGFLVFARPRIGTLEPDIVGMQDLAIEAKAYDTDARGDIVDGYYQLHAYMTALDTRAVPVREGFIVAFRLDGPTYDTPPALMVGRHLIHSLTVDLGPPATSGRNQARVQPITEREILDGVRERGAAQGG